MLILLYSNEVRVPHFPNFYSAWLFKKSGSTGLERVQLVDAIDGVSYGYNWNKSSEYSAKWLINMLEKH